MVVMMMMMMIIIISSNNSIEKYWAVFGPKLFRLPRDTDCRGPDYRGTTVAP